MEKKVGSLQSVSMDAYFEAEIPVVDDYYQKYLAKLRNIVPAIRRNTYPFKGIRLSRANVERLLQAHHDWQASVSQNNSLQWEPKVLDLRGANLQKVDLRRFSLKLIDFSGANLRGAHLEGADLSGVKLRFTHLEGANLSKANLAGDASLPPADLRGAFLDNTTNLSGVILGNEKQCVLLSDAHWEEVNLSVIDWSSVKMLGEELEARQVKKQDGKEKDRTEQISQHQIAVRANRQLAVSMQAQGMSDEASHFGYRAQKCKQRLLLLQLLQQLAEEPKLSWVVRKPSTRMIGYLDIIAVSALLIITACSFLFFFTVAPHMVSAMGVLGEIFYGFCVFNLITVLPIAGYYIWRYQPIVRVVLIFLVLLFAYMAFLFFLIMIAVYLLISADLRINLFSMLLLILFMGALFMTTGFNPGFEPSVSYVKWLSSRDERVRTRWQSAIKGMLHIFSTSSRFIKIQNDYARYVFSLFLDLIAGYGYKPGRGLLWYFVVIFGFASAYHFLGSPQLPLQEAFVLSVTSFHGRGFFPGDPSLNDPRIVLAAFEAVTGLIIEISFIATFTQRFFGK